MKKNGQKIKTVFRFARDYPRVGIVALVMIVSLAFDLTGKDVIAHWLLGITAGVMVIPLLWDMWKDLRSGSYGLDILAATAIITAILLGEFWAAIIIVLMLTGGESLEDYAEGRAKKELSSLLENKPKTARIIRAGKVIEVKVRDIRVGDKVIVSPGEVVPVDGVIIEGSSSFDESSLTGESLPIEKKSAEKLLSGSVNIEGAITMRAEQTAANSQYEQIIKLVKAAASSQSPFVRLADRYSIPFTVVSFIIAGTVWYMSGEAQRFLQVLVVATPCPLLLGAPIALISGMSRSAKHGIIVKNGSALERLAEVETVAFDKTGTLTRGIPKVGEVKTFNKFTKAEVIAHAAALEQGSNHILAKAIVDEAAKKNTKLAKVKQIKEHSGRGLEGRVGGKTVFVGRLSFLEDSGVALPREFKPTSVKQTATYVAIDDRFAGVIAFQDELRPESKAMLRQLEKLKIRHTLMVTGDNQAAANAIAKQLHIENVVADALPADKITAIETVAKKPVAFVGDGVNDAPVLTAADVGIALGARGSTAASESADVVIMLDDVSKVAKSFEIAKRTFSIARQSIFLGILMSFGLMGVFATGRFPASLGAGLQEVVDVAVIINALRAHRDRKSIKG